MLKWLVQLSVPALANPNPLVLMDPILASKIFSVQKKKTTKIILKNRSRIQKDTSTAFSVYAI